MKRKRKKRGKNFIYDNLVSAWGYLKKTRNYFFVAVILILIGVIFGYSNLIGVFSPELAKVINQEVIKSIEEMVKQTQGMGSLELTEFIIFNNIKTALSAAVFGIFFAVFPVFVVVFNGYVLGFVAGKAVDIGGVFILWKLIPHGIFEIPAILISICLGLRIGVFPLYIKEKVKGFSALLISFIIFIILLSVIFFILSLFGGFGMMNIDINAVQNSYENFFNNPFTEIVFFVLLVLSFVVSLLIGLRMLSLSDRKIVIENIKNSFRVFVYIVIPFLVIAGIIEGLLIWLIG